MSVQELTALIQYIQFNKTTDSDWFTISSDKDGTHWFGKCWYIHELLKYEFDFEFDVPATYPTTAPEIQLPELDGKTAKMYRGGKICLTVHFKPLWAKNRCQPCLLRDSRTGQGLRVLLHESQLQSSYCAPLS